MQGLFLCISGLGHQSPRQRNPGQITGQNFVTLSQLGLDEYSCVVNDSTAIVMYRVLQCVYLRYKNFQIIIESV